jgi:hypothetical protein
MRTDAKLQSDCREVFKPMMEEFALVEEQCTDPWTFAMKNERVRVHIGWGSGSLLAGIQRLDSGKMFDLYRIATFIQPPLRDFVRLVSLPGQKSLLYLSGFRQLLEMTCQPILRGDLSILDQITARDEAHAAE